MMVPEYRQMNSDPFKNLTGEDWPIFVEKCYAEGLSGLIFHNLGIHNLLSKIEPNARQALETDFLTNYGRNTILEKELYVVSRHFNQKKIRSLLIRGGSLFNKIYPSLGARPMVDLDFVISESDFPQAKSCLSCLGYDSYPNYPYFYFKEGIYIDIHLDAANFWRVKSMQSLISPNNKELWSRSQLFNDFLYVRFLDTYDALICTADHMLWHSFERLIWFMDIYFLLNDAHRPFVWQKLFDRAEQLGHFKPLVYVLNFVDFHKIYILPKEAKNTLQSYKLNLVDKKTIYYLQKNERRAISGEILAFLSIKTFARKMRALCQIIFISKSKFPNTSSQRNTLTYIKRFINIMFAALRKIFYLFKPAFLTKNP